jgi:hypothetical protein
MGEILFEIAKSGQKISVVGQCGIFYELTAGAMIFHRMSLIFNSGFIAGYNLFQKRIL